MNLHSQAFFAATGLLLTAQAYGDDLPNFYSKRLATPINLASNFGPTTHAVQTAKVQKSCNAIVALPGDQVATFCRDGDGLEGAVYRFDKKGKTLGFAKTEYVGTVPAVLKDGTIVAASNRVLYWIKNDKVITAYRTSEKANLGSVAVLSDNTVVVPEMGYPSRILWMKDGVLKHELKMDFPVASGIQSTEGTVSVDKDDSIIIGHGEHNTGLSKLTWVDANAKVLAEIDLDTGLTGSPVIFAPGKVVLSGYDSGHGGSIRWYQLYKRPRTEIIRTFEYSMGNAGFLSSGATLPDGTVVGGTGSLDGKTYVIKNGRQMATMSCTIPGAEPGRNGCGWQASAPVLFRDGTVIFVNQSGIIQWWKKDKKTITWKFNAKYSNVTHQPAILSDGTVVVSNERDVVAWVQLKN